MSEARGIFLTSSHFPLEETRAKPIMAKIFVHRKKNNHDFLNGEWSDDSGYSERVK
jgi:hypothetical protein